jgi:hypothetical protein
MEPWDVVAAAGLAAVSTVSVALWTLRVALAARGRRLAASGTASVEALLFVVAFGRVMDALDEPVRLVGYAAGVAAGTFIGLTLETRAEERRMSAGRAAAHGPADRSSLLDHPSRPRQLPAVRVVGPRQRVGITAGRREGTEDVPTDPEGDRDDQQHRHTAGSRVGDARDHQRGQDHQPHTEHRAEGVTTSRAPG